MKIEEQDFKLTNSSLMYTEIKNSIVEYLETPVRQVFGISHSSERHGGLLRHSVNFVRMRKEKLTYDETKRRLAHTENRVSVYRLRGKWKCLTGAKHFALPSAPSRATRLHRHTAALR